MITRIASDSLISLALTVSYARQNPQNVPLLRVPSCRDSTNFATGSRFLLVPRGNVLGGILGCCREISQSGHSLTGASHDTRRPNDGHQTM